MPKHADYVAVAEELKGHIDHRAFATIARREVTEILRRVSGEPRTRIKSLVARDMTEVLAEYGLSFYPALEETDTRDNLRLFRTESVIAHFVEMIAHPSPESDIELGVALKKIKGTWQWHKSAGMELQAVS
jgi:hypothetical protein